MKVTTTREGLQSVQFADQAGNRGIAKQSGEVDPGNPSDQANSSYLLLGREDAPLTLSIEQVGELVDYLEKWLDEGRFVEQVFEPSTRHVQGPHRRPASAGKDPSCAVDSPLLRHGKR